MRFAIPWVLFQATLLPSVPLVYSDAQAQIYTCTAADGTRVFSDKRCGKDAKVVPGITTTKRSAAAAGAAVKAKSAPKTAAELEELIKLCNAGDMAACTTWTLGGGPNHLREKERKAQLGCEGGSLSDCEERYCKDGATGECRTHVLQAAKLSGKTWYLRAEERAADGAIYDIRCMPDSTARTHDVAITCATVAGPARCSGALSRQGFARLDQAATNECSAMP
jgi:hypothetical protein